jgi:hypothetical protein
MSYTLGKLLLGTGALVLGATAAYQLVQRDTGVSFYLTVAMCCLFAGSFLAL